MSFYPKKRNQSFIKKHVNKAERGLGVEVKGSVISGINLVKVYMTGKRGAGRMIVLIYVRKDKIVGMDLAKGNQAFQDLLEKNLSFVVKDLREGNFDEL